MAANPRMGGVHARVKKTGMPGNKPVIFIHGWPLDAQMWRYQVNELAGKESAVSPTTGADSGNPTGFVMGMTMMYWHQI